MDFFSKTIKSINFPSSYIIFEKYPDITVPINIMGSKSYPYLSFYINLFLDKTMNIAPKSSGVISISPAKIVFKVGTTFRIDKSLQQKGINAYSIFCWIEKKSRSIVLKNSGRSKVVLYKGVIGQTFENIEIKKKSFIPASKHL